MKMFYCTPLLSGHLLAAWCLQSPFSVTLTDWFWRSSRFCCRCWSCVFAVFTASANWLFGMATEFIGNIITPPPWSVCCQLFLSGCLTLWLIIDSGQWICNFIGLVAENFLACLVTWPTVIASEWQGQRLVVCLVSLSFTVVDIQLVGVYSNEKCIWRIGDRARESNNQSAICLATDLLVHLFSLQVSCLVIQSHF